MSELCYIFSLYLSTENFGEEQAEALAFKGSYGLTPKECLNSVSPRHQGCPVLVGSLFTAQVAG